MSQPDPTNEKPDVSQNNPNNNGDPVKGFAVTRPEPKTTPPESRSRDTSNSSDQSNNSSSSNTEN